MRIIDIDTLVMKQVVSAASAANDAIDNAVDSLNRVTVHNDWGCKEKNAINDYTITNRNKVSQLQENSRSFLNTVTQVANEFESSENSILDMFGLVESVIADAIGIGTPKILDDIIATYDPVEEWNKARQRVVESLKMGEFAKTAFEAFEVNTVFEPICVTDWESLSLK